MLAVALLYRIVAPRFGSDRGPRPAPSRSPCSRRSSRSACDTGVDPLLILLMLAACGACAGRDPPGLAALADRELRRSSGSPSTRSRWRRCWCVPGIAVAYLVCAPGSVELARRLRAAGRRRDGAVSSWSGRPGSPRSRPSTLGSAGRSGGSPPIAFYIMRTDTTKGGLRGTLETTGCEQAAVRGDLLECDCRV